MKFDENENVTWGDYNFILYGPPKVGKTRLMLNPIFDSCIADTERGSITYKVQKRVNVRTWDDYISMCKDIRKSVKEKDVQFKTLVIDTIDNLIRLAIEYLKDRNVFTEGPEELKWGKGWAKIKNLLLPSLAWLFNQREFSVWLISHVKIRVENGIAGEYEVQSPSMDNFIWKQLEGLLSGIIIIKKEVDGTYVYTKPSKYYSAGIRRNFRDEVKVFEKKGEIVEQNYFFDDLIRLGLKDEKGRGEKNEQPAVIKKDTVREANSKEEKKND